MDTFNDKFKVNKTYGYCPHCRRRTEHVKVLDFKICKTCGKQEDRYR